MAALLKGHRIESPDEEEVLAGVLHKKLRQAGQLWGHPSQLFYRVGTPRPGSKIHYNTHM